MKLCLLAIGFVLLLSIDEGESWLMGSLPRRKPKPICKTALGLKCRSVCFWCPPDCRYTYRTCSRRRKKRNTEVGEDYGSFWVQLPCKFSVWDTDKDGSITRPEFAFAGHTGVEDSNTVFKKVDKDGNEKISRGELDVAPLWRENC